MEITKEEAITRIEKHILSLNDNDVLEALRLAIKALENMGCGCVMCLIHNNMVCPKMSDE